MTTTISIPVDTSILLALKVSQEEFARQMLFASALALYRQRKLSLGKAAELAGYSRIAFIEELRRCGEPIFDFSEADVQEIIAQANEVERIASGGAL